MKKTLLGVLALTSVASFANVTGYVKSDSKAEVKSEDITVAANDVAYEYGLSTKLDLGLFLDANKDTFVFAGGELKKDIAGANLEKPGYLGVRFDGKVTENSNMSLTGAYRIKNANVKDAIIEHLKAKKIWNDKASDDDKNALLREQGYSFDKDDTLLLSGVGNGKYDNINYRLGMIYTTKDFANGTHKLESFVKADTKLEKVDIAAELTHRLGNYKKFVVKENEIKETDAAAPNLVNAGRLNGKLKLNSDRLAKDLTLESKTHFDLGTILPEAEGQIAKVGTENKVVYKGVKNVELTGKVNYNADVLSKYNGQDVQEGNIHHKPELFLGIKYDNQKLMLSTENTDKVDVKHNFVKIPNTSKLENFFKTDNKVEYKPVEGLSIRGRALDIIKVNFADVSVSNDNTLTNSVVAGLGLTATPKLGKVKFENKIDAFYRLDNVNVKNLKATDVVKDHEVFAWTTNKVTYDITDALKLEGNLNAHTYNKIDVTTQNHKLEKSLTVVKAAAKINYKHANVDFVQELIGRYRVLKNGSNLPSHLWAVESDTTLNYDVVPNIQINSGLNLYTANKLTKAQYKGATMFVEAFGMHDDEFYSENQFNNKVKIGDDTIIQAKEKEIVDLMELKPEGKKILTDKESTAATNEQKNKFVNTPEAKTNIHLVVSPKLGVTMKFLDNKLTVKPAVEARVIFRGEKPNFAPAKFDTKGTLNVEYVW